MKKNQKVSIIIRTKNEDNWLEACLKSISLQSYKNYEIIIVDNGSKDRTLEIAKKYETKIVKIKKFIPGKAINDGIKASNGKIIVCLSAHCIPTNNNWLKNLIKPLINKNIAGCYGRQKPLAYSSVFDKRDLLTLFGLDVKIHKKDPFFHNANSAFTKSIWKKFPFDEKVTNIEDRIWASEVLNKKYIIKYEPEASVFHYHGVNQDRDYERCSKVVNILEKLFDNYENENISNNQIDLKNLKICAIIPLRGETTKIKNKSNLEYTINSMKKSKYLSKIVVSTDNNNTRKEAIRLGAESPFLRPKNLSQNFSDIISVANHTLDKIEKKGEKFNLVFLATSDYPFRDHLMYDLMIEKLVHSGLKTIVSASDIRSGIWLQNKKNSEKKQIIDPNIPHLAKEEDTLKVSIGHGCLTYPSLIRSNNIFQHKYDFFVSDSSVSHLEISNQEDFKKIEKVLI